MKKIFIAVMVMLVHASYGCDFCNCYLGLNPHYKKNTISFRYHLMDYAGTELSDQELTQYGLSKKDFYESRANYELHAQFYPTQRLQLVLSLPYSVSSEGMSSRAEMALGEVHHSVNPTPGSANHKSIQGIGDGVLLAHYQVFNHNAEDSTGYRQRLLIGPGIKIPLGRYKVEATADVHEHNHQPGSGSWDAMASIVYLGKLKRMGINVNLSYVFTSQNSQYFRFGNKFNSNITAYYEFKRKRIAFYPNAGLYVEQETKNKHFGHDVTNSGSTITYAHLGADMYWKKFSLNTAFQLPATRSLGGNQSEIKYRIIVGLSYAFN
jgi:hypothetical protein